MNSKPFFEVEKNFYALEDNNVRCFLAVGTERALLVDTGFGGFDLPELVSGITDRPLSVINTHADGDHIGGNRQFERVHMHPSEFDRYYSKGNPSAAPLPIWSGAVIDLGGFTFEVIHNPGHTPGSISLLEPAKRMLIGGDVIQDGDIYMFGPGRNMQAYISSLYMLDARKAEFDLVYASHASIALAPGIIPKLILGAENLLNGKLTGQAAPNGLPCRLYRFDAAGFLF